MRQASGESLGIHHSLPSLEFENVHFQTASMQLPGYVVSQRSGWESVCPVHVTHLWISTKPLTHIRTEEVPAPFTCLAEGREGNSQQQGTGLEQSVTFTETAPSSEQRLVSANSLRVLTPALSTCTLLYTAHRLKSYSQIPLSRETDSAPTYTHRKYEELRATRQLARPIILLYDWWIVFALFPPRLYLPLRNFVRIAWAMRSSKCTRQIRRLSLWLLPTAIKHSLCLLWTHLSICHHLIFVVPRLRPHWQEPQKKYHVPLSV